MEFFSGLGTGVAAELVYKAIERVAKWVTADRWKEADELTRLFWLLEGAFGNELPSFTREELARSWGSDAAFRAVYDRLAAGDDPQSERGALVAAIEPLVGATENETAHELAARIAEFLPYLVRETKTGSQRVLYELQQARLSIDRIEAAVTPLVDLERHIDSSSRRRVREARHGFVGREWVFERLEEFAEHHGRGYLRIEGAAGLGKTALAAAIADRYHAPAYFIDAAAGRSRPSRCLNHLSAELIERFQLPHEGLPEGAGEDSGLLSQLLDEAAAVNRQGRIWLVIDALDEAERLAPGTNPMLLPRYLPQGVICVLTHRPGDYTLSVEPGVEPEPPVAITGQDPRQMSDIKSYLRQEGIDNVAVRAAREAPSPPVTVDAFAERLAEASEGNFMHVRYVLADIASRHPPSLDIDDLPQGLHGYYEGMWRLVEPSADSSDHEWEMWFGLRLPLVEKLAAAAEPVDTMWLADHVQRSDVEVSQRGLRPWERFLAPESALGQRRWRVLHHSFRSFVAEKVDLVAVHRGIADYYLLSDTTKRVRGETQWPAERWSTHGGYAMRHVAGHLRLAGDYPRLFLLIDAAPWKAAQLLYDASGTTYHHDIAQAWSAAVEVDAAAIKEGTAAPFLFREVVCALTTAELYSFSAKLPKELSARLLAARMWTPEQALAAANRTPEPTARAEALAALIPHLAGDDRRRALVDALAAAKAVTEPRPRALALVSLMPYVTEVKQTRVFSDALDATAETEPYLRVDVLAALLPRLSDEMIGDALVLAADVPDGGFRSKTIALVVPYLHGEQRARAVDDAFASAIAEAHPDSRGDALAAIAPYLPGELLNDAVAAANEITKPGARAKAFVALLPYVQGARREHAQSEALIGALADTNWGRAGATLATLAPYLPEHLLAESLTAANAMSDPRPRAVAVTALARHLPAQQRTHALEAALAAAIANTHPGIVAHALAALAPELQHELLTDALAAAGAMTDPGDRAKALIALIPYLPAEQRDRAVREAHAAAMSISAIHSDVARYGALADLAPHLPEDLLREAISTANAASNPYYRATTLAALASHLPDKMLADAVGMIASTPAAAARGDVLAVLAPYLPSPEREQAISETLAAISATSDPYDWARVYAELVPSLRGEQRAQAVKEALKALKDIPLFFHSSRFTRADVLSRLAPYLPDAELANALSIAMVTNFEDRPRALAELAPRLPDELLFFALNTIISKVHEREGRLLTMMDGWPADQALAIAGLAPSLPVQMRAAAMTNALLAAAAEAVPDARADALVALAPHIPDELLSDALAVASVTNDPDARVKALAAFLPHLRGELRMRAHADAIAAADSAQNRAQALAALAPHMPENERAGAVADALMAAYASNNDEAKAEVISTLAPHLPEELLVSAIAMGSTMREPRACGALFSGIAPHLSDELLVRAAAAADGSPAVRTEALAALAPSLSRLSRATVHKAWDEALRGAAQEGQTELARIVKLLVPLFRILSEGRTEP